MAEMKNYTIVCCHIYPLWLLVLLPVFAVLMFWHVKGHMVQVLCILCRVFHVCLWISIVDLNHLDFFSLSILIQMQGKKEIDELRMKLQEMSQLHEKAVNELMSSRSDNEELSSQKVWYLIGISDALQIILFDKVGQAEL